MRDIQGGVDANHQPLVPKAGYELQDVTVTRCPCQMLDRKLTNCVYI